MNRPARYILPALPLAALLIGCADDPNDPNRPPASVVSPDDAAGTSSSGGVNGTYDRPGPALPDGTSGRFGASGSISGGDTGRTEDALRPGSTSETLTPGTPSISPAGSARDNGGAGASSSGR